MGSWERMAAGGAALAMVAAVEPGARPAPEQPKAGSPAQASVAARASAAAAEPVARPAPPKVRVILPSPYGARPGAPIP